MSFYLLRKYQKWILLPVGILMAISFGVGGLVSGFFSSSSSDPYVGKIFGQEISREDFLKHRSRMLINSRGRRLEPRDVFQRIAMLKECDKRKITVTKEEVQEEISGIKGFQNPDGVFDNAVYESVLLRNNINPVRFEAVLADDLRMRKLREQVMESATVNDKEVMERYHQENDKLSIQCVWVTSDKMEINNFKPTDKDIEKYYTENKDSGAFDSPPKRKIEYILIPFKAMRSKCTVSEGEIKDYYEKNKKRLYVVKQKKDEKASAKDKNANESKDAEVEKADSKAEKTAETKKKENEDAEEEQYKPLEKVNGEIREKLMTGKTRELARQTANTARRIIGTWPKEEVDFREVIKKEELTGVTIYGHTDFLSNNDSAKVPAMGNCRQMIADAMSVKESEARRISMPITVQNGVVVTRVTGVMQSKLQELERVRDDVIRDLKKQKKEKLAEARAKEIRKEILEKEIELNQDFAKKEQVEFKQVEEKTARSVSFTISGLFREALKTEPGTITEVIRVASGYGFAKVLAKNTADEDTNKEDVKKKIAMIRQNMERQKKYLKVWQWQNNLLERANIEIYSDKKDSKKKDQSA